MEDDGNEPLAAGVAAFTAGVAAASKEPVLQPPPKRTRTLPAASISCSSASNAGSSDRIDRRSTKTVLTGTPALSFGSFSPDNNTLTCTFQGTSLE